MEVTESGMVTDGRVQSSNALAPMEVMPSSNVTEVRFVA